MRERYPAGTVIEDFKEAIGYMFEEGLSKPMKDGEGENEKLT